MAQRGDQDRAVEMAKDIEAASYSGQDSWEADESFPLDYETDSKFERTFPIASTSTSLVEEVKETTTGLLFARKQFIFNNPKRRHAILAIFANEVKAIRRLQGHVHFVRVHAAYATDRSFNLVLEPKASDGDLAIFLANYLQRGPSDTRKTSMASTLAQAFGCLASGLSFMHEHKIRHKDIKPGNILIHHGMVYWIDFGYSKNSNLFEPSNSTGGLDGGTTDKYAAFEVLSRGKRNSKADVFSLACVYTEIYFALAHNDAVPEYERLYAHKMGGLLGQLAAENDSQDTVSTDWPGRRTIALLICDMGLLHPSERPSANSVCLRILTPDQPGHSCGTCRSHLSEHERRRHEQRPITTSETVHTSKANRLHAISNLPRSLDSTIVATRQLSSTEQGVLVSNHLKAKATFRPRKKLYSEPSLDDSERSATTPTLIDHGIIDEDSLPYSHVRMLGHGHSGTVEKVVDRKTNNVYARKTIRISPGRRGDQLNVFQNEVGIIRKLDQHHHIVRVHATYMTKRDFGILLEPVASEGDLHDFLTEYRNRSHDDASKSSMTLTLHQGFGCLASGLAFMHGKRIRHKDIKPSNILIHGGTVIFTDFGYSFDTTSFSRSTTEGPPNFLTPMYSAPEVLDNGQRNTKSDVYALGCVFFNMLSALTLAIVVDPSKVFAEIMDDLHKQLRDSTAPVGLEAIYDVILGMTERESSSRLCSAHTAHHLLQYAHLHCARCRQSADVTETLSARPSAVAENYEENAETHSVEVVPAQPERDQQWNNRHQNHSSKQKETIGQNDYNWFEKLQTGKSPLAQSTHASAKKTATGDARGDTRRTMTVGALPYRDPLFHPLEKVLERGISLDPGKLKQEFDMDTRVMGLSRPATILEKHSNTNETSPVQRSQFCRAAGGTINSGHNTTPGPRPGRVNEIQSAYYIRDREFFVEGKVFGVLPRDMQSPTIITYESYLPAERYSDRLAHTKCHLFVVVRLKREFCFACPVFTYTHRATLDPEIRPEEHGIIYSRTQSPQLLPGEKGIQKFSIGVTMAPQQPNLHFTSRVCYSIYYPIPYAIRVRDIGQVLPYHIRHLLDNWRAEEDKSHKPASSTSVTGKRFESPFVQSDQEDELNLPGGIELRTSSEDILGQESMSPGEAKSTSSTGPELYGAPKSVTSKDTHAYHPLHNVDGYDPIINPHVYHPVHNPYAYHPTSNSTGHHPSDSPNSYHPQLNPHGFHPRLAPFRYHPHLNPHGYHAQQHDQGYHPTESPFNYHPKCNPDGYHAIYNEHGYHPVHNSGT